MITSPRRFFPFAINQKISHGGVDTTAGWRHLWYLFMISCWNWQSATGRNPKRNIFAVCRRLASEKQSVCRRRRSMAQPQCDRRYSKKTPKCFYISYRQWSITPLFVWLPGSAASGGGGAVCREEDWPVSQPTDSSCAGERDAARCSAIHARGIFNHVSPGKKVAKTCRGCWRRLADANQHHCGEFFYPASRVCGL